MSLLSAGPRVRATVAAGGALVGLAGALVAAWVFVRFGSLSLATIAAPGPGGHPDFEIFHDSARAFLDGGDIYATPTPTSPPNLNPPALTLVLSPLGLLDQLTAYRLFTLLTLALVVACLAAVAREVRLAPAATAVLVVLALLSSPVLQTLRLGQVYGLLAAGVTVAWLAQRRGAEVAEGAALAVVVALKPSFAPILLLPLVQRRWRAVLAAAVTGVVVTVLPLLRTGPGALLDWLDLVTGSAAGPVTYPVNASLAATLARLSSANEWSEPLVRFPGGYLLGEVVGVVLIAVTAWVVRRRAPDDPGVWALAAAALVASPVSWQTYLVVLLPGLVVVAARGGVVVLAVLGPALVGEEWIGMWRSSLPLSLYAGVLLVAWLLLLVAAAARAGSEVAGSEVAATPVRPAAAPTARDRGDPRR